MSDLGEKLERVLEAGGPAQRTSGSLVTVRGGARTDGKMGGKMVVSICPMEGRSFWQHDGTGRWDLKGAIYFKIDPSEDELEQCRGRMDE